MTLMIPISFIHRQMTIQGEFIEINNFIKKTEIVPELVIDEFQKLMRTIKWGQVIYLIFYNVPARMSHIVLKNCMR